MEKLLIVCRHGAYDDVTDHLNADGRWQFEALANCLKPVIGDRTVCILSSTADRALESAEILQNAFGLNAIERHELLWSESGRRPRYDETKILVSRKFLTSDVVILVTHLEYTRGFSDHFITETVRKSLGSFELEKGQARVTSADGVMDYIIIPAQPPRVIVARQDDFESPAPPPTPRQETRVLEEGDDDFPF